MGEPGRQHQPVDLLEFKRRLLARTESPSNTETDPLAELARVIGGSGRIVAANDEPSLHDQIPAEAPLARSLHTEYEPEPFSPAPPSVWPLPEQPQDLSQQQAPVPFARIYGADYAPLPFTPTTLPIGLPRQQPQPEDVSHDEDLSQDQQDQSAPEFSFDDHAEEYESADLDWRRHMEPEPLGIENTPLPPLQGDARQRLRNHKRAGASLYVTTAAVVVAGIAAGLFMRPGGSSVPHADTVTIATAPPGTGNTIPPAGVSKAVPTIQAKADAGAQLASTPPSSPAGAASAAAAPVSPPASAPPSSPPSSSPQDVAGMMEPKPVRTVPIYGSGIAEMGQIMSSATQDAPAPGLTYGQVVQAQDLQPQPFQPPASAPPKPAVNDAGSPQNLPGTQQAALVPPPPKVSARPAVRQAALGPAGGAATYAALLAAPTASESDAHSMLDQLEKKYGAMLGAHKLTYHRVKVGNAIVYEIRTAGLTDNQAKTLCAKLSSAGTSCRVASQ